MSHCFPVKIYVEWTHFADDIFKGIFLNENIWIPIKIWLKFVPKGPMNNIPALVQIMAWCRSGDKPLSEPMIVSLLTHICVNRPQWVNIFGPNVINGQPVYRRVVGDSDTCRLRYQKRYLGHGNIYILLLPVGCNYLFITYMPAYGTNALICTVGNRLPMKRLHAFQSHGRIGLIQLIGFPIDAWNLFFKKNWRTPILKSRAPITTLI